MLSPQAADDDEAVIPPPWKIKVVEPIALRDPERRREAMEEAGWNTFLLRSDDVFIDLLTDSGTSAMSQEQRAAMELGDEAYAGSRSFFRLEAAMQEVYGYRHLIPTHQGRGAEHLLARVLVRPGSVVPSNLYFTTSRAHVELAGGIWRDVSVPEAIDPASTFPFKGNIDLVALERVLHEVGPENVAFVRQEACLNMAGGQPFSLDNLPRRASADAGVRRPADPRRDPHVRERRVRQGPRARVRRLLAPGADPRAGEPLGRRRLLFQEGPLRPHRRLSGPERRRARGAAPRGARPLRGLRPLRRHGRARHGGPGPGDPRGRRRGDGAARDRTGRVPRSPADRARRAHRRPRRRPRGLPRREADTAARPAGPVPGAVARGRALPRRRRALDGARHRLRPARRPRRTTGSSWCG